MATPRRPNKPLLLFATPRSGSTPIYHLLLELLKPQGVKGLGEFFELSELSVWTQGETIVESRYPVPMYFWEKPDIYSSYGAREMQRIALEYRLSLIRSDPQRYFIKLFPSHLAFCPAVFSWLSDHYDWIFLERRDLWNQLLSFVMSMETGLWYSPSGIQIQKQVTVTTRTFSSFEKHIWGYEELKIHLRPSRVLVYEKFRDQPVNSFLAEAGFCNQVDLSEFHLPSKQHDTPKERAIENIDEVRDWFAASFLSKLNASRGIGNS